MASKEFIQNRIDKAQENITKKETLIVKMTDRIAKNIAKLQKMGFTTEDIETFKEDNWNPYKIDRNLPTWDKAFDIVYSNGNAEDSIESATKALKDLYEKLEGYQEEMESIIEKENSRDIKVIIEFLEQWKSNVKDFYLESIHEWERTLKVYHEEDKKYIQWYNGHFQERNNKELNEQMELPRKKAKAEHSRWNFLDRYMERTSNGYEINLVLLQKDLDEEANRKYDFIIERTNKIVGQITDASSLKIGAKGDLNGFIIGTKGTAKVQTIGAGGYNIQCYHFRTLINPM